MKLGASQSIVQSDIGQIITSVWGGSPTPRSPHHRARLLGVRAVRRSRFPVGGMSSPLERYRGGGWGDGGRRGGGGGIFYGGWGGRVLLVGCGRSVIISDKFQQSMSYENVEVPQIQFFDSGWTFLLGYGYRRYTTGGVLGHG